MGRVVSDINASRLEEWYEKVAKAFRSNAEFFLAVSRLVKKSLLPTAEARQLLLRVCALSVVDFLDDEVTENLEIDEFNDSLGHDGLEEIMGVCLLAERALIIEVLSI